MMKKGVCKLCKQEKLLCNKSHIFPKHTYKLLKEDGYCLYINKNNVNKENKQKDYSGVFESNILCENCEQKILSKYETYGNNLIFLNKIKKIQQIVNNKKIIITGEGYDYSKIKLYLLSVLWKSSISTKPFFGQVKLKKEIEEKIRKMLLDNNPGEEFEFPILAALPNLIHGNGFDAIDIFIIQDPYKKRIAEVDVYVFSIAGQSFYFIINDINNFQCVNSVKKDSLEIYFKSKEQTLKCRKNFIDSFIKLHEK